MRPPCVETVFQKDNQLLLTIIRFCLQAKEQAAGTEIDGRRIRCDFSITERAHTPTPGIYLGKPT